MKILGIETSCDETSASIVENGKIVLSNIISSQVDLHAITGGVVPEVAAREHLVKILPVIDEALKSAKCNWSSIDALAVTKGPGLISSLIMGTQASSVISYVKKIPLIPLQHIAGHIYSNWLEVEGKIEFPVLVLTVSGGHNELILMRGHGDFKLLGESRDDAAGEAFDKVARILGLGYPGGPVISKTAEKGSKEAFKFPRSYLEKGSLDFSFSGLKTAVLNEVKNFYAENSVNSPDQIPEKLKRDLAASFQEAVVDVLSDKLLNAYKQFPQIKEIHLAGGVSANLRLREIVKHKLTPYKAVKLRYPSKIVFCTDNAAMVACAAFYLQTSRDTVKNIVPTTSFSLVDR